jgi:hypothetical protein
MSGGALVGVLATLACGPPPIGWQGAGRLQTLPSPETDSGAPTTDSGDSQGDAGDDSGLPGPDPGTPPEFDAGPVHVSVMDAGDEAEGGRGDAGDAG